MLTAEYLQELKQWRRHIHQHPETAFEEFDTAKFVADKLRMFGLDVVEGLAKTGVVGVLTKGNSARSIAIRADMDALDMQEKNIFSHSSTIDGKMHACGHDGHTTMLLGAAKYLSEHGEFNGTIYFIFQPAEECDAGGKVMIDDGLFEQFPCDEVYSLHNWPGLPLGTFAVMDDAMMASCDEFAITITTDKSGHAAFPHLCQDTISVGADMVTQLNQIVSRKVKASDTAVLSVTKFTGGTAYNILPETVEIWGTVRAFSESVQEVIEREVNLIVQGAIARYGVMVDVVYDKPYCPTINHLEYVNYARESILAVTGHKASVIEPSMGSEDFGYMLKEKPGCIVLLGNGDSAGLHHCNYDFNDESISTGVEYWVDLSQRRLSL